MAERTDTELLDWLESKKPEGETWWLDYGPFLSLMVTANRNVGSEASIREALNAAIDAAIAAEEAT